MMSSPYYDSEEVGGGEPLSAFENAFSEKAVRMGFIRKVYGILMLQLCITVSFICVFLYVEEVRVYSRRHPEMFIIALVLMFILMIMLVCCDRVRRQFPLNMICLFLFTIVESFLLGSAASHYDADAVAIAIGICAVVCLTLTIFAFQTKYDFTTCGGFVLVSMVILILFGFLSIFLGGNRIYQLIYGSVGALLFSFYLIYDTQLIIGGSHKYSISPEEYIFAALNLYLDVINLFLYILQIVSASRSN